MYDNDSIKQGIIRNLIGAGIIFGACLILFIIISLADRTSHGTNIFMVLLIFTLVCLPISILLSGIINGIYLFIKDAPVAAKVNLIISFVVFLIFGVCMLRLF